MKFKCPACGKILKRDMRGRMEKSFLTMPKHEIRISRWNQQPTPVKKKEIM